MAWSQFPGKILVWWGSACSIACSGFWSSMVLNLCQPGVPSPLPLVAEVFFLWEAKYLVVSYLEGEAIPRDPRQVSHSWGMGTAQFECIQSRQTQLFFQNVDNKSSCTPQACFFNVNDTISPSSPAVTGNKQPSPWQHCELPDAKVTRGLRWARQNREMQLGNTTRVMQSALRGSRTTNMRETQRHACSH